MMQLHVQHAVEESSQLEARRHVKHVLLYNQIVRHVLQLQHAQLATQDTIKMVLALVNLAQQL